MLLPVVILMMGADHALRIVWLFLIVQDNVHAFAGSGRTKWQLIGCVHPSRWGRQLVAEPKPPGSAWFTGVGLMPNQTALGARALTGCMLCPSRQAPAWPAACVQPAAANPKLQDHGPKPFSVTAARRPRGQRPVRSPLGASRLGRCRPAVHLRMKLAPGRRR